MSKNWRHNTDGLEDEKQREAHIGCVDFRASVYFFAGDSDLVAVAAGRVFIGRVKRGSVVTLQVMTSTISLLVKNAYDFYGTPLGRMWSTADHEQQHYIFRRELKY